MMEHMDTEFMLEFMDFFKRKKILYLLNLIPNINQEERGLLISDLKLRTERYLSEYDLNNGLEQEFVKEQISLNKEALVILKYSTFRISSEDCIKVKKAYQKIMLTQRKVI